MKATKLMMFLLLAGTACVFTSCDDSENSVPEPQTTTVTFEGEDFNKLIDNQQYGGSLLYGGQDIAWTEKSTTLSGIAISSNNAWGCNWDYGTAISNYIEPNIKENGDYKHQLAVPVGNGSQNFAVVWEYATIAFADSTERQLQSIALCPTTYLLNVMQNGNSFCKALTKQGSFFTLTLTANNGASINVDLARDGKIQSTWKTIDLSSLGKVRRLKFSFSGSDEGQFGLNTPKYIAIDNIVVITH